MSDHPALDPEEMARLLRASIQKQRPRRFRIVLLTLLVAGALLAPLVFWPHPELPRLNLIALDQVAGIDETVGIEGWLTPQDPRIAAKDLGGLDVTFDLLTPAAQPGRPSRLIMARSESDGHSTARWQTQAGDEVVELKASHAAIRPRYRTEDRARLFVWKAEISVLLVEVAALAAAGPEAWRANQRRDVPARESAATALQAAHAKSYKIIYLAAGAARPMEYRLMRGWVETKSQEAGPFPDGPVVGQLPISGTPPAAQDWATRLAELKRHWRGSVAAVVQGAPLAAVLRDAGATTFVLAEAGEVPPNTTRLATWADLPERLPGD